MSKFIFVLGGVISGTGKGVSAASLGLLLKQRGFSVSLMKFDPYLNLNAGVLAPREHGECFLCDDGTETDLDLGHYERIAGVTVSAQNICTSGTLHKELQEQQERGTYLGQTLQIIPHVTDMIQNRLLDLGKESDVVLVEIGGTVGDIESMPYYESICEFRHKHPNDVILALVAPVLFVPTISEFKTKPLQNSVRELRRHALTPDIILCRVDRPVPDKILDKVSKMTVVDRDCVFDAPDVQSIYEVPLEFYKRHVDDMCVELLGMKRTPCRIHKHRDLITKYIDNKLPTVTIGVFGKYDNSHEAYMSLKEACHHAGAVNDVRVNIRWINSEELEKSKRKHSQKLFEGLHGVIIPGGFDKRGVEGKIIAAQHARKNKVPFLGICLGLQCAVIEFARNVCKIKTADSEEFNRKTKEPVVYYIEGQKELVSVVGTMRLGAYDCVLSDRSMVRSLYGRKKISERHRHRLEVNRAYEECFAGHGFYITGENPQTGLVEVMELDSKQHPFYVGTQAHPEFRSKPTDVAPLFRGLVAAAKDYKG